jgi:acyl carrier protein
MTNLETEIRDFLAVEVWADQQLASLDIDDPLIDSELLDSIAVMQVVTFCEQVFEFEIPEEELLPKNFGSIRAIAALVEQHVKRP